MNQRVMNLKFLSKITLLFLIIGNASCKIEKEKEEKNTRQGRRRKET